MAAPRLASPLLLLTTAATACGGLETELQTPNVPTDPPRPLWVDPPGLRLEHAATALETSTHTITLTAVTRLAVTARWRAGPGLAPCEPPPTTPGFCSPTPEGEVELAPGQSHPLIIVHRPAATGRVEATLEVWCDAHPGCARTLPLHGLPQPERRGVVLVPAALSLGEVVVGDEARDRLLVLNHGTEEVSLRAVAPAAGPFQIAAPEAFTLPPGGSRAFEVTFAPSWVGSATAAFTLVDRDGRRLQFDLQGEGSARCRVALDPDSVRLIEAVPGRVAGARVDLRNLSGTLCPVTASLELPLGVTGRIAGPRERLLGPREVVPLDVELDNACHGPFRATLRARTPSAEAAASLYFPDIVPMLGATPERVRYRFPVGCSVRYLVEVTNPAPLTVTVQQLEQPRGGLAVWDGPSLPFEIPPGGRAELGLTLTATEARSQELRLDLLGHYTRLPSCPRAPLPTGVVVHAELHADSSVSCD